jgi:4-amino-4-deoxy-L-arabinose transferase-like glycosyltransferase
MNQLFGKPRYLFILITILSLAMHSRIFKLDLIGFHVWRQTETQTVINNFTKDDFNIFCPKINDKADGNRIMRMEFPLMQWIIASFCKIFNHNVFVSRIFTFIIGLFSVFGMYFLLRQIFHDPIPAAIGTWAFNFSPVFYYYTVNPLPDNLALCFAIWGMVYLFRWMGCEKYNFLITSAIFLSLSALVKLPFILYFTPVAVFYFIRFKTDYLKFSSLKYLWPFLILLVPVFAWYLCVIPTWNGNGILTGLGGSGQIKIAGLFDILQFNLWSSLPELLINYGSVFFFISGFYFLFKNNIYKKEDFQIFLYWGISIILYFLFEMNMIAKVHDYYLFPFLPLLFIIVAYGAWQLIGLHKRYLNIVICILLLVLPFTAYLRVDPRWNENKPGFNKDFYIYRKELQSLDP